MLGAMLQLLSVLQCVCWNVFRGGVCGFHRDASCLFGWALATSPPPPPLFLNHSIIAWEILWKWSHYLHFEKKQKKQRKSFHLPPINRSAGDASSGSSSRCDPSARGLILEDRQRKSCGGVSVVAHFFCVLFIYFGGCSAKSFHNERKS